MAGSSNQFTYNLGATVLTVPTGATGIQVTPPAHCLGWLMSWNSGSTVAITNQLALGATTGFYIPTSNPISVDGPAQFFLVAGGATSTVGIAWKLSSGISLLP